MNDSPSYGVGLVAYFHILTHVDGIPLDDEVSALRHLIQADKATVLTVLDLYHGSSRRVQVTPHTGWGGEGLLGLVLRYDDCEYAEESVIHVLDVQPGSPAALAGLNAQSDYLLGTAEVAFLSQEVLGDFLQRHDGKPCEVFVFNSDTYSVRAVALTPNSQWGGAGSLGCATGTGFVHKLPIAVERAGQLIMEGQPFLYPDRVEEVAPTHEAALPAPAASASAPASDATSAPPPLTGSPSALPTLGFAAEPVTVAIAGPPALLVPDATHAYQPGPPQAHSPSGADGASRDHPHADHRPDPASPYHSLQAEQEPQQLRQQNQHQQDQHDVRQTHPASQLAAAPGFLQQPEGPLPEIKYTGGYQEL